MLEFYAEGGFSYWLPEDARGEKVYIRVCMGSKYKEKKSSMVRLTSSRELLFSNEKKFSVNAKEEKEIREIILKKFDMIIADWESVNGKAELLNF